MLIRTKITCLLLTFFTITTGLSRDSLFVRSLLDDAEKFRFENLDSSLVYAEKALNNSEMLRDTSLIMECNNFIAMFQKEKGLYNIALMTSLDNITLGKKVRKQKLLANALLVCGHIYAILDKYDDATKKYNEALKYYTSTNDSTGLSYTFSGLGIVSSSLGKLDSSLFYYKLSESFWRDDKDPLIAGLWVNTGAVHTELKSWKNAELYYNKALKYYQKKQWRSDLALVHYNLGELFMLQLKYKKAELHYLQALLLGKETGSISDIMWGHHGLYEIYKRCAKVNKALDHFEKYNHYKDSLNTAQNLDEVTKLEKYYQTELKQQKLSDAKLQLERNKRELELKQQRKSYENKTLWISILVLVLFLSVVGFLYLRLKNSNGLLTHQKKSIEFKNEQINKSLNEKLVLLKEIHHRVKNNLQIISSLLNLQSQLATDPNSQKALVDSQGRIQSIALVHQKLYQSETFASINFKDYIKDLVYQQYVVYSNRAVDTHYEITGTDAQLSLDTAIPIGLIVSELVTNSFKYAFEGKKSGHLQIDLQVSENNYLLTVKDDGHGLPQDFNLNTDSSLGMQIVTSLTEQLMGEIKAESTPGATFEITFQQIDSSGL